MQLVAYWSFREFEPVPFLLDLSLISPLYHNGWYLQYLFLWYVVFFCVRRVEVLDKRRVSIFAIVSLVLFLTQGEIRAEQSLSFLFGIHLSERKEWVERLFCIRFGLLAVVFGVVCLALKQLPLVRFAPQVVMSFVQLGIKLPIGFGLMVLCYAVMERWGWVRASLGPVGVVSYELYLVHGYVLLAVPLSALGLCLFVGGAAACSICLWWAMRVLRPLLMRALRAT